MNASEREANLAELARRVGEHLLEGLERAGIVRVKLLLVDAGGDRQLVTLEPPDWKLQPRNGAGELLFLEGLQLVGVERADRDAARPLEDVIADIAGEG